MVFIFYIQSQIQSQTWSIDKILNILVILNCSTLHVIRASVIFKIGSSTICICIKSSPEKLNYLSHLRNRIPITSRLKHLWRKKKKRWSAPIILNCFVQWKVLVKLLSVAICSISFFWFVSNLVDLLVKDFGRHLR